MQPCRESGDAAPNGVTCQHRPSPLGGAAVGIDTASALSVDEGEGMHQLLLIQEETYRAMVGVVVVRSVERCSFLCKKKVIYSIPIFHC